MRVKARLRTLAIRALAESMEVKTMVHVARRMFGNYDLYERTGFPQSVPIPNRTAASQIVTDVAETHLFLEFVGLLMSLERVGMAGRKYKIPRLNTIVTEILDTGYRYNSESGYFVEDRAIRTTRNWGVLREGESYLMSFLGVDVSGNSDLVRMHGQDSMQEIYQALRQMATDSVERRNGRLWGWEGDGGLFAFTFEDENERAVHSGVELLHELFLYNLISCPLPDGLHVRLTIHNGPCEYQTDGTELKVDTVKRLWDIDTRYGRPDWLTISAAILPSLDHSLSSRFEPIRTGTSENLYAYSVRFA
jgi:hypothetical protein